MPRRNYIKGRRRPSLTGDAALQRLANTRPVAPVHEPEVTTGRDGALCTACGGYLPPTWPYPEHAACRSTSVPAGRGVAGTERTGSRTASPAAGHTHIAVSTQEDR